MIKTLKPDADSGSLINKINEIVFAVNDIELNVFGDTDEPNQKTIRDWQVDVHTNAKKHGWYDTKREVPELLCLIHSEISEALEAYRVDDQDSLREELADVAIRLLDMCEFLKIDLESEIDAKHKKNLQRPYRHGNKRC